MAEKFNYVDEIWNIADYLRDIIKRSEYNKVVLPFALLRRLECALEPTREAVCKALKNHEKDWTRENTAYCKYSKKCFYNVTNYRLNNLGSTNTLDSLMAYIEGFSPNAREILRKFKFRDTCSILEEHKMLYYICGRFSEFDLSPENVSDREMSDIYEHLIERFGEEIAEDAEDFMTPRDVVRLAVSMIFANDDELMNSDSGIVRTLYDPTLGTAGFISDALDLLEEWHKDKKMKAPSVIVPYGQECEQESWAMGKANLLLRNIGGKKETDIYDSIKDLSAHIAYGNTLKTRPVQEIPEPQDGEDEESYKNKINQLEAARIMSIEGGDGDAFPDTKFNYILSNPPYGKKWEKEKDDVTNEAKLGFGGRFGAGLPSISDGSMLFLQHVVSKFYDKSEGISKAGIVLSGSPLFTGDAGSGPANIRRWLFEKDYIDCIVKLPTEIFFRTGISTYLWILQNNKPEGRKGMIQLIDASSMKTPMRRSQGNKRYYISEDQIRWVVETYIDGHDHGNSVIVPVEDFMYRKVTTQRPLRMVIKPTDTSILIDKLPKLSDSNKNVLIREINSILGKNYDYFWADEFASSVRCKFEKPEYTSSAMAKAIREVYGIRDENGKIVKDKKGNIIPDPDLKDTEDIPYNTSFDDYMKKEVLPFAPDTWIDESVIDDKYALCDNKVGVVGTNISFNKYFYKYEMPRDPDIIAKEILDLENGLEAFMESFLK